MLHFSIISDNHLADLLDMDAKSNPHPWKSDSLGSSYFQFENLGLFVESSLIAYMIYQKTEFEAEIIHFVCDKTNQRQGFARQLLSEWIRCQLAEYPDKKLFLEVRTGNERAKKLYSSAGFVEVGHRKGYYSNLEDAILMSFFCPPLAEK